MLQLYLQKELSEEDAQFESVWDKSRGTFAIIKKGKEEAHPQQEGMFWEDGLTESYPVIVTSMGSVKNFPQPHHTQPQHATLIDTLEHPSTMTTTAVVDRKTGTFFNVVMDKDEFSGHDTVLLDNNNDAVTKKRVKFES